jgi:Spy/CpxP family protein refolding chaperone
MRRFRRPSWAVLAGLVLGIGSTGACAASSANAPPTTTPGASAAEDEATTGLVEHHRHHHHGGVTLFVAMSLDTLGVAPEQQAAVEKIRTGLQAEMEPARVAEQKLITVLADGLEAPTLDTAAVDAAVAQVTTSAAATHDASADAIDALHGVLTPPQRVALVDKIEAHWVVWQEANAEDARQTRPEADHLAAVAEDLALTTEQVERVRANLAEAMKGVPPLDSSEIATRLHAFGAAFREERFDGTAWTAARGTNARLAAWGATHMARFVESVRPALTPDQRAAFARTLREHASHNPGAQANQ